MIPCRGFQELPLPVENTRVAGLVEEEEGGRRGMGGRGGGGGEGLGRDVRRDVRRDVGVGGETVQERSTALDGCRGRRAVVHLHVQHRHVDDDAEAPGGVEVEVLVLEGDGARSKRSR